MRCGGDSTVGTPYSCAANVTCTVTLTSNVGYRSRSAPDPKLRQCSEAGQNEAILKHEASAREFMQQMQMEMPGVFVIKFRDYATSRVINCEPPDPQGAVCMEMDGRLFDDIDRGKTHRRVWINGAMTCMRPAER